MMLRAAWLLLWLATPVWAAAPALDAAAIARSAEALARTPHHLAGTPEGRAAGEVILAALRDAGFDGEDLIVQPFAVAQLNLAEGDCYVESAGRRFAMQPLRPNGLALPVTAPDGLDAQTVYLRDGSWPQLAQRDLRGRIAVLDWDSGDGWRRAFRQGAAAVVFVGPTPMRGEGRKWLFNHAPLPRFCVSPAAAQEAGLFDGRRVRLFCRMAFQPAEARNIIAVIPGTDGERAAEATALATAYDSYGVLPFASRSTRRDANVAGLIEAARWLRQHPQPRTTLVVFFDADAQDGLGQLMLQCARARYTGSDDGFSFTSLIGQRQRERAFVEGTLDVLADAAAVLEGRDARDAARAERQALLGRFELLYNDLRDERMELLLDRAQFEKDGDARAAAALAPAIEAVERRREAMAALRRAAIAGALSDQVMPLLEQVIADRTALLRRRLGEIDEETRHCEAHRDLGRFLAERQLLAAMFLDLPAAPAAWTLSVPSASPQTLETWNRGSGTWGTSSYRPALVSNAIVSHWLEGHVAEALAQGELRHVVMPPATSYQTRTATWRTTAVGHLVLVANALGAPWPDRALPIEPPADHAALASALAEALSVFTATAARDELRRMRLPAPSAVGAFAMPQWIDSQKRYRGNYVRRYGGGAVEAQQEAPGAFVAVNSIYRLDPPVQDDITWGYISAATVHGTFAAFCDHNFSSGNPDKSVLAAAQFDAQGRIASISQYNPAKGLAAVGQWDAAGFFALRRENRLSVFDAEGFALSDPAQPMVRASDAGLVKLLRGINNVSFSRMCLTFDSDLAAVWLDRLRPFKLIDDGVLALGNDEVDPVGRGVAPDALTIDVPRRAAGDTWTLNESRLSNLRRYGIVRNDLERRHDEAQSWLEAARDADGAAPRAASARRDVSLGLSSLIYQPVRDVTNDLIKAVVILLLLAIPFSFAFERLVFGSPNIYRQISAFLGTFLAVFAILYVVHPAFRIATFPVVVLLAFVIIIMSAMVIYIMWARFEHEIKHLQGIATASHRSTRSQRGTLGAAVALGISTMRRRPLRTTLTAVTIILLTFTILFFGAFNTESGVRRIDLGPASGPRVVEVGLTGARPLSERLVEALRASRDGDVPTYTRHWHVAAGGTQELGRTAADRLLAVEGWSWLDPRDLALHEALLAALHGDVDGYADAGGVWLPAPLAEEAGVRRGDTVHLYERDWICRGTFDPAALAAARSIHGTAFVPPDVEEMLQMIAQQYPNDAETQGRKFQEVDLGEFPLVDAGRIVLLWDPATPLRRGATSMVLLPATDQAAYAMAERFAALLNCPVTVRAGGQVDRVIHVSQVSLSGFSKLLVPLLLGGLIIFSTMLSSVSDREREIFTFSAVGLAPLHVAVLFFAEASVYAVLGGLGGYLFSQVFGKGVEAVARLGWITAPSMNYSSLSAMVAIVIVMATVLLSTLYPAFKASRAANPGVQRRWKMRPPDGDVHEVQFPFTVSQHDLVGLISFLEEYFLSNADTTVGAFAADEIDVHRRGETFELAAKVWLPPFDQGVSQTFRLRTAPSDIEGIDEVHITMQRLSGSPVIWQRSNRLFIDDIRQQFIFWRTISEEDQEHYHQLTVERFGQTDEVG